MSLQTLFWVIIVSAIAAIVAHRVRRYIGLKRLGWTWVEYPALEITAGLNRSPFGLGFDRAVRDQVVGNSPDGTPFQAFRYSSDVWKNRRHVVCMPLPHPMPAFHLLTTRSSIPAPGGLSMSTNTHTMIFPEQDYGRAVAAAIDPFLPELGAKQLTIDHDQLVLFGIRGDLKFLKTATQLLARIRAALMASPAMNHVGGAAPQYVSFTDRPDWEYVGRDDSLLQYLPLTLYGHDHEVVDIVKSRQGPISFIRVTHTWKTRNAGNRWYVSKKHTEYFCSFWVDFTFIPISVNMGRGKAQQFESSEFNKRFKVHCPSPRFASDVFHQRQIEHLLCTSPTGFAIAPDGAIQVSKGEWLPEQIGLMQGFLWRFFGWIPDFVWKELNIWPRPIPKQNG
jgi:hypothetical protein